MPLVLSLLGLLLAFLIGAWGGLTGSAFMTFLLGFVILVVGFFFFDSRFGRNLFPGVIFFAGALMVIASVAFKVVSFVFN